MFFIKSFRLRKSKHYLCELLLHLRWVPLQRPAKYGSLLLRMLLSSNHSSVTTYFHQPKRCNSLMDSNYVHIMKKYDQRKANPLETNYMVTTSQQRTHTKKFLKKQRGKEITDTTSSKGSGKINNNKVRKIHAC